MTNSQPFIIDSSCSMIITQLAADLEIKIAFTFFTIQWASRLSGTKGHFLIRYGKSMVNDIMKCLQTVGKWPS